MANCDDHKWIEKVKSEGAVPLLKLDKFSNGWASPPGKTFMLRGPEYFRTKVKIPGSDYILKPLGFDWLKNSTKISEVLNNPRHRVRRAIRDAGDKPFVWAFNLQVPGKDNFSAVAYFVSLQPAPEGSLIEQFVTGDDAFRQSRLKMIANIVKGPWIVRKAVGEQAICVIGRALTCKYCLGENFIEVDIDIGSSIVANAIVHLALGYLSTLTVDLAFLIESQTESELPERVLAAVRISGLNIASARQFEGSMNSLKSSPSSPSTPSRRFWNSIGNSFSNLISTNPPQDSGASNLNGDIDREKIGEKK